MSDRDGHYKVDNGESYCFNENEYGVFHHGDEVATGPQPDNFCSGCRKVDLEWEEVTLEEFNRMFA